MITMPVSTSMNIAALWATYTYRLATARAKRLPSSACTVVTTIFSTHVCLPVELAMETARHWDSAPRKAKSLIADQEWSPVNSSQHRSNSTCIWNSQIVECSDHSRS